MRNEWFITLIIASALLTGCKKEEATPTPPTAGNTQSGNPGGTRAGIGSENSSVGATTRPSGSSATTLSSAYPTTGPSTKP